MRPPGSSDLVDLLAVGLDSRLRFGDEGLLALPELGELAGEGLLGAFEVGRPARQPVRDALLRFREAGAELRGRLLSCSTTTRRRSSAIRRSSSWRRESESARSRAISRWISAARAADSSWNQAAEIVASPVELGLDVGQALGALLPA